MRVAINRYTSIDKYVSSDKYKEEVQEFFMFKYSYLVKFIPHFIELSDDKS